jgi:pyruvate/2-oxoglutarate dehydrogenase complex dihydrolipoamide dehydrogenase (E3) component
VEGAGRLAERDDPRVSELLEQALRADGVDVRTNAQATRVSVDSDVRVVGLDDGSTVRGERLVIATGRRPRSAEIGLETIGITLDPQRPGPIPIDEHCRVADGVWAAGDCTGVMLFTHLAKYQARSPWRTWPDGRWWPTTGRSRG